ncbi:class I SAM-dependent methyltransferase [Paracoccus litorisediminis]|jgi:cyclopropane-fatty-acyl-phospholipid synthase|uniref:class I SAM-dependent methyltransferase n=1 Tax=Paracoccus litorisediminis TaxID=2006130 RepID=UPI001FE29551|nr:class I SAM-dependent methyltransferase [Paracoccus litorisediminis]
MRLSRFPTVAFDRLASVGIVKHIDRANMRTYCARILDLLRSKGIALNHGVTLTGFDDATVDGRLGEFIKDYIFSGDDLLHVSQ